jgi:hypothetical protein
LQADAASLHLELARRGRDHQEAAILQQHHHRLRVDERARSLDGGLQHSVEAGLALFPAVVGLAHRAIISVRARCCVGSNG